MEEFQVTSGAGFVDDLGADGLDTGELVMAFEEAFRIGIADEDAAKVRSVMAAAKDIQKHAKGRK